MEVFLSNDPPSMKAKAQNTSYNEHLPEACRIKLLYPCITGLCEQGVNDARRVPRHETRGMPRQVKVHRLTIQPITGFAASKVQNKVHLTATSGIADHGGWARSTGPLEYLAGDLLSRERTIVGNGLSEHVVLPSFRNEERAASQTFL